MKGSIQSFVMEDKSCHVYLPPGEIAQKADTVYVLDGEDFAGRLEEMEPYLRLETCRPFRLVFFDPVDWNRDYSPWPAPAVFRRGEAFAGKAGQVLSFLRQRLIPEIQDRYPGEDSPKHRGLLGYSLGGLCALWMLYTSGVFRYAAACSPSVWYEGWQEFVKENTLSEESRLYLSLGNREEKTRNPHMARVGDVMRMMEQEYRGNLGKSQFCMEWNEGGHFQDVPLRMAKGLQWVLQREETAGKSQ